MSFRSLYHFSFSLTVNEGCSIPSTTVIVVSVLHAVSASHVAQQERTHLPMQETQETQALGLGQEDNLEEEMGSHSQYSCLIVHGQMSLAGCSPWGHKESDTTEATQPHACNDISCLTSLNILTCHLFMFISEVSVLVLSPFKLCCFLIVQL